MSATGTSQTVRTKPTVHFDALGADVSPAALGSRFEAVSDVSLAFREQMGLPTNRPVVMTGHQPVFWHPGIAAKYHAGARIAGDAGAAVADVIVDIDAVDPFEVRLPASLAEELPETVALRLGPTPIVGRAAERTPPVADPGKHATNTDLLDAPVRASLGRVIEAMRAHAGAASGGEQVARANLDALGLAESTITLLASRLAQTAAFAALIGRLSSEDPGALALYNEAVDAEPGSGVSRLDLSGADPAGREVPLWTYDDRGVRRPARVRDLRERDARELRPRGLVMTGLLRAHGCELFIHGKGGGAYDRATERWFASMGTPLFAPMVVVSADLYLPNEPRERVTTSDVASAAWLAHHAAHHPAALGDGAGEARRAELLGGIRNTRRASRERRDAYEALHAHLEISRRAHVERLSQLEAHAERLRAIASWQRTNAGRWWPAFVYPDDALNELRGAVSEALARSSR